MHFKIIDKNRRSYNEHFHLICHVIYYTTCRDARKVQKFFYFCHPNPNQINPQNHESNSFIDPKNYVRDWVTYICICINILPYFSSSSRFGSRLGGCQTDRQTVMRVLVSDDKGSNFSLDTQK